jgi:hypothetical protein
MRSLTSGGSLKRLSRKRPRLNSISRAEPLATVTRLRWFRENMLAVRRLCLPCALPALPGFVAGSLDARPPSSRAGNLQLPGSQTPPPETTPGPGRARHPPHPPPPKAQPARPVRGRQASQARQSQSQGHPILRKQSVGASSLPARVCRRLTWAPGGPKNAPPHQSPPPVKSES